MYQIHSTCVGCHNCAEECPTGAISFVKSKYEVDPERCTSCGHCAEVCHISAISDPDHPYPAPPPHELIRKACDVVVCGGGTGLIAAVRAAQAGKKVILLEKAEKLGGNTDLAHMFFPVFCQKFADRGLPDVREDAIEEFSRRTCGVIDKKILRSAVYGSSEFFDWFCRFDGVDEAFTVMELGEVIAEGPIYGPAMINFPNRMLENLKCRDQSIGPGWAGTLIKHVMEQECRKLGVEIFTKTAAVELLTDQTGAISGVVANNPGGQVHIDCKACILAVGGMGRGDEKLREFVPWFFNCENPVFRFSVPTDTGDAIDLTRPLGCEPDRKRIFCSTFGPAHHPFSYTLYRFVQDPRVIHINLNGKRWLNEMGGCHCGRFSMQWQPKQISYGIMTQRMIDENVRHYTTNPAAREEAWIFRDVQKDIDEELALGYPLKKADTLAELAVQMGVEPSAFLNEVARYNELCAKGTDEDYGKDAQFLTPFHQEDGPFYAIFTQRFSEGTFGGLTVDQDTRVLKQDGTPVPGLYGVGDATSALQISGELAVISELTWATASAYLSGNHAAQYIS